MPSCAHTLTAALQRHFTHASITRFFVLSVRRTRIPGYLAYCSRHPLLLTQNPRRITLCKSILAEAVQYHSHTRRIAPVPKSAACRCASRLRVTHTASGIHQRDTSFPIPGDPAVPGCMRRGSTRGSCTVASPMLRGHEPRPSLLRLRIPPSHARPYMPVPLKTHLGRRCVLTAANTGTAARSSRCSTCSRCAARPRSW